MPGFNQLEEFEKDLFSLGNEAIVRRDRGEKAVSSHLPTSTYIEDDSDDFAAGRPQQPPSFKSQATTPHLDLEEEVTKAVQAASEDNSVDDEAGESEIVISKPPKLSEEDFDDIIDNLSFDNLDVLPDWNALPTEEFFNTADEDIANDDTAEEGATDDGVTDEGATDDGVTEESATDDGVTEETATDDEVADEGATDDGVTDEGATDDGVADEGTTDDGVTDEGATDDEVADEGATDEVADESATDEVADEDATDDGVTDESATDDDVTDESATDDDVTDEGTTDDGVTEEIATDEVADESATDEVADESATDEVADEDATDDGVTDESATDDDVTDEGTTDDGVTDEGATDDGVTEETATDDGVTEETATDDGVTDEGTTDDGVTDEGATDDEVADESATDDDVADEGATDDGVTDEGATDDDAFVTSDVEATTEESATDDGVADEGATDDGVTEEGATDDDAFVTSDVEATTEETATDDGVADEGATDDDAFVTSDVEATTEESATDDGVADEGATDDDAFVTSDVEATTEESATDDGVTEEGTTDDDAFVTSDVEATTEESATDDGVADEGATDDDAAIVEETPPSSGKDETQNEKNEEELLKKQKVTFNLEAENLVDKFNFDYDEVSVGGGSSYAEGEPDYSEFFTKEKQEIFLRYLNRYPLNLRIATEKVLMKKDLPDRVVAEIFRLVLKKSTAAVLADYVSNLSDNYIEVPTNFEGRSNEAFEKYKGTLQYQIRNRLVPTVAAVVLVGLVGWLLAFFGNRFIYHPICASLNYKSGYNLLETGAFPESEAKFSTAVSYWPSKKWFFKYAEGYRTKRQYERAGKVFETGMAYFPKDYNFGLEYARMHLEDLGNYKTAENIVRRYVLDRFINLSEGILLLGDIYLDWATELNDEERFEDAYEQYSFLMAQEGQNDLTLSRMMRYFIRTDQLRNVLPIKNYFYEEDTKEERLSPRDLSELGAYLLEKLYGEIAPKDEYLRGYIEDVKSILEKAVLANPADPEPQYNMSRYFIETENPSMAQAQLEIALRTFGNISAKNRRQLIQNIDSYRLLGELYRDDGEYLRAEEEFVKGINMYESESVYGNIPMHKNIGKLYSDLADLDYFISGDLDAALLNYQNSIKQGNVSPSIQYRIGYIQYAKENYDLALLSFADAVIEMPRDSSVLLALANSLHLRDNNFAAQGYYERLLEELTEEKNRRGVVLPQLRIDDAELADNYMRATNNYGVVMYHLAQETGKSEKIADAMVNFAESARAWDAMTRNPETLIRLPTGNLASQNSRYSVNPEGRFDPAIYMDIPRTLNGEKILKQ